MKRLHLLALKFKYMCRFSLFLIVLVIDLKIYVLIQFIVNSFSYDAEVVKY